MIGDDIKITVGFVEQRAGKIKLNIEAPKKVAVWRQEIYQRIQAEKLAADEKEKSVPEVPESSFIAMNRE